MSALIGCRVPMVDFEALAEQFAVLEKIYEHELNEQQVATERRATDRSVANPHIVHIAGYVCPRSGTLFFSAVKLPEGLTQPEGEEDCIKADALTRLLQHAGTKLVVIASGDSLALISRLLPVVHVISPQSASARTRWRVGSRNSMNCSGQRH